MIDLDALEAKARAASPGPWRVWSETEIHAADGYDIADVIGSDTGSGEDIRNAAYIAALNPVVALALIARIRELEADLAHASELLRYHEAWEALRGMTYT